MLLFEILKIYEWKVGGLQKTTQDYSKFVILNFFTYI